MKTLFEYLLSNKSKNINDPLEHVKFEFDIDDEAKDIFDPNDDDQVVKFKDNFLGLSDKAYEFLKTIQLKIRVRPHSQLRDDYSFYVRFNQLDEYYEKWEFNKVKNKFVKPESNCRQYYGYEWHRKDSMMKDVIGHMVYSGIYDLGLKR